MKPIQIAGVLASLTLLVACSSGPESRATFDNPWREPIPQAGMPDVRTTPAEQLKLRDDGRFAGEAGQPDGPPEPQSELFTGDGRFYDLGRASAPLKPGEEGDVTFNFHDADIRDVVQTILGDILGENYIMDDAITGKVHLQTSRPLQRDALIPTLEKLLQVNGAALVNNHDFYEIVPVDAVTGGRLSMRSGLTAERGYQLLVVPLRYIGAKEMARILEPVAPQQGLLEVDERRNLLLLGGTQSELVNLRETIQVFDVDQLAGMSVGLFRLDSVEAEVIMDELNLIFGDQAEGPLAGMVHFLPIERLNGLLVLTPQKKYLRDAQMWIERLDRAEGSDGLSMYVYYVQNGKAENLADMLSQLFDGRPSRGADNTAENPPDAQEEGADDVAVRVSAGARGMNMADLNVGDVSIIADTENNALLIMASPADYGKVHKAVEKLDVLPLQVLVEATIVEVSLEDELRYGLQWFFKNELDGGSKSGRGTVGSFPINSPTDLISSATYEVFDAAGTRLLLNTLAADSRLNVVSSPSLMVLDNHTATIRVGDQVPVRTSETTNTSSDNFNTTNTIQFKDTGVLLEVTPRVNAGGMVVLDITQEVNDVDETTTSEIDSPTIIQRRINTSVAVQSGETLVLGGLIKENRTNEAQGVPVIRHVPVLGWFFGSQGKSTRRTELVVMITPTAVTDRDEAREVTREYRNKLQGMQLLSRPRP